MVPGKVVEVPSAASDAKVAAQASDARSSRGDVVKQEPADPAEGPAANALQDVEMPTIASPRCHAPALRGLNIQWPFAQLILQGAKSIEARRYRLGHRDIAKASEHLWLIETPGPICKATKNALVGDRNIAPRPAKAQIIGTVCFSHSAQYKSCAAFRKDARNHCIREGGEYDWDGTGEMHGWAISSVRALAQAIPAPANKSQTGLGAPRSFEVTFADTGPHSGAGSGGSQQSAAGGAHSLEAVGREFV